MSRRALAVASYACVDTWLTDFRDDLPKLDVPTLVLDGTADGILPIHRRGRRAAGGSATFVS